MHHSKKKLLLNILTGVNLWPTEKYPITPGQNIQQISQILVLIDMKQNSTLHHYNSNNSSCVCSIWCHFESKGGRNDLSVRILTELIPLFFALQSVTFCDMNRKSGSCAGSRDSTLAFHPPRNCRDVFFVWSTSKGFSRSCRTLSAETKTSKSSVKYW